MQIDKPAVNEIVNLLHDHNQIELSKLANTYPQYEKIVTQKTISGTDNQCEENELKFRAELCKEGLKTLISKSQLLIPQIKKKIKWFKNLQLISQVIVAVSSSSLLLILQTNLADNKIAETVVASLTLFASVLSLILKNRFEANILGNFSLSKIYEKLIEYKIASEHNIQELTLFIKLNLFSTGSRISKIIKNTNNDMIDFQKLLEKFII